MTWDKAPLSPVSGSPAYAPNLSGKSEIENPLKRRDPWDSLLARRAPAGTALGGLGRGRAPGAAEWAYLGSRVDKGPL